MGAALGVFIYGLLAFGIWPHHDFPLFGANIYDRYYLAMLEGRFDLPATVLRYEGHYAPDGTGYLYHGVAPLLTRFALPGWFHWTGYPLRHFPSGSGPVWDRCSITSSSMT